MSEARVVESLVSTIVPVFNRPRQLREAVASVLAQDWRPIEILVVDDGSTDETPLVARELAAAHPEIRVITQANGGPGAARENGRSAARGEFIQYLDSDDVLLPGKFCAQVAALRAAPDADVAYGITWRRDAQGRTTETPYKGTGTRVESMFPQMLMSRWWETATPLYRRRVVDAAGPWTSMRMEEDWEYDCRIAASGGKLAWVAQPVSESRDHRGPRLSGRPVRDAAVMRDRARCHALILAHARRAGITSDAPQMQHFARELFLLARQCGAAGLGDEARELFALSREAAGPRVARRPAYAVYRAVAAVVGWRGAGRLSEAADRLRKAVA